jgi:hypothetical protein
MHAPSRVPRERSIMKRPLVLACAAAATLFAASAAQAAHVSWSVGIDVPPVATIVSGGPAYYPAPVRYVPPPVLYAPAPVYAPPVAYGAPYDYDVPSIGLYASPVYYGHGRAWVAPRYGDGRGEHRDRDGDRHEGGRRDDDRGHRH